MATYNLYMNDGKWDKTSKTWKEIQIKSDTNMNSQPSAHPARTTSYTSQGSSDNQS